MDMFYKNRYKNLFLLNLFISLLVYGMFLKVHFSVDTYSVFYDYALYPTLNSGRLLDYLIVRFLKLFNINIASIQILLTAVLILSTSYFTLIIYKLFERFFNENDFKINMFVNFAVLTAVINVFILEWFLYPEIALFYSVALLSSAMAVVCFCSGKRFINYFFALIFLIVTMNSYQAAMPLFIIFSIPYVILENKLKFSLKSVFSVFMIFFAAGLSSIINIIETKAVAAMGIVRTDGKDVGFGLAQIMQNVKTLLKYQLSIWLDFNGMFFKYIPVILILILILLILFCICKNNEIKIFDKLYVLLLIFTAYISVYIPHLFVGSIWLAQRTIVGVFSFVSILFIIALYFTKNKWVSNFVFAAVLIFITLNVVKIKDIGLNHFQVNALDREYAVEIQKHIEKYEDATGITVNNIATVNDINPTYNYWGIKYCSFDTNVRAFVVDWGPVNIIKYYSGRNYNSVEMNTDIYDKYFKDMDWNRFNFDQQAFFDDDTLYFVLY